MMAALVLLAACASSSPSVTPTTLGSTTTPAPTTTAPVSTTAVATTTTTIAATTTTEACPPGGSTAETAVAFPDRMSPLVGRDIRTGAHGCYERVVIEFQAAADGRTAPFPGYRVRYVTPPVDESPSGEPMTLRGTDVLLVSFSAWMQTMELEGYGGPWDIVPTNVTHILELRRAENFEGMAAWAVGLDGRYPYVVTVLDGPPRLVIDVLVV